MGTLLENSPEQREIQLKKAEKEEKVGIKYTSNWKNRINFMVNSNLSKWISIISELKSTKTNQFGALTLNILKWIINKTIYIHAFYLIFITSHCKNRYTIEP